ncbi:hypothetical protein [Streptomyces sp. NBC_01373]|uniref:hypothetical protein n=1 Tax=Streptomyces sp. NBC_01373 TaxID=2903843 RepID=UPI002251EF57|nr:hypothetical protein [Streptomyces sp. NBC_01373]MCX4705943.1 hypothetical protein [Streptomyces sp. NBC_01373]
MASRRRLCPVEDRRQRPDRPVRQGPARPDDILVNAVCPGYCATDLNNHSGHRTAAQGAVAAVRMATVPDDGPTGTFSDENLLLLPCIDGIDVAALWMVAGERGRPCFSVGSPAPASSQGW